MSHKSNEIYTSLALIYDHIMKSVDYEDWADFIDAVIQEHYPEAERILELACGTGKIAMYLDELDCYDITATDRSEQMLEQAQKIASFKGHSIQWERQDFYDIQSNTTYDIILMLFDSVNYIHKEEDLQRMFKSVQKVMHQDSLFIFDFTTFKHSKLISDKLDDEGVTADDFRYVRKSYIIEAEKLHINEFEIEKLDKDRITVLERFREVHRQKMYEFDEMHSFVKKAGFIVEAAYDDFDLIDATARSERITMVLSCPNLQ